jgi:hypothetical protein
MLSCGFRTTSTSTVLKERQPQARTRSLTDQPLLNAFPNTTTVLLSSTLSVLLL